MNDLATYRKRAGLTQVQFAALLGISQGMACRLETGVARPSLDLAVKIERVTGGAVPVETWVSEEGAAA